MYFRGTIIQIHLKSVRIAFTGDSPLSGKEKVNVIIQSTSEFKMRDMSVLLCTVTVITCHKTWKISCPPHNVYDLELISKTDNVAGSKLRWHEWTLIFFFHAHKYKYQFYQKIIRFTFLFFLFCLFVFYYKA